MVDTRSKKSFFGKQKLPTILLVLALLALSIQTVKDSFRNGDFIGYLNAGNLVLSGQNIYADYLNTWPPFFSVAAVPLAVIDNFSPLLVRFLWLLGSLVCLFFTFKITFQLFFEKTVLLPFQKVMLPKQISFTHPLVLVPFLLSLRFLLDNSSHLQINIYIMTMALASVFFYYQKKFALAAFLLGLSIALKVFPVFVLVYFLYKRAYKMFALSIVFVFAFVATTIFVFGWSDFLQYHQAWLHNQVAPLPTPHHMNQSLMALFVRLFSETPTGIDFSLFVTAFSASKIKLIYYATIFAAAIWPLYLFREKLVLQKPSASQVLQWAILFAVVPILSPVAWKPYFVFLWMPTLIAYYFCIYKKSEFKSRLAKIARILFYTSMILLIGCSELFVGNYVSDLLEVLGAITWGTIILIVALLIIYVDVNRQKELPELAV